MNQTASPPGTGHRAMLPNNEAKNVDSDSCEDTISYDSDDDEYFSPEQQAEYEQNVAAWNSIMEIRRRPPVGHSRSE